MSSTIQNAVLIIPSIVVLVLLVLQNGISTYLLGLVSFHSYNISYFLVPVGSIYKIGFVVTFYCCITSYHTFSGFKQHQFIISQFWRSDIQAQQVFLSGFHMAKVKVWQD